MTSSDQKSSSGKDPFRDGTAPFVAVDGTISRGVYWICFAISLGLSGFSALGAYAQQAGRAWDLLGLSPLAIFECAIALYLLGWTWRWLFTGRVDHLIFGKKYYSGRFEESRKTVAAIVSFIN